MTTVIAVIAVTVAAVAVIAVAVRAVAASAVIRVVTVKTPGRFGLSGCMPLGRRARDSRVLGHRLVGHAPTSSPHGYTFPSEGFDNDTPRGYSR